MRYAFLLGVENREIYLTAPLPLHMVELFVLVESLKEREDFLKTRDINKLAYTELLCECLDADVLLGW